MRCKGLGNPRKRQKPPVGIGDAIPNCAHVGGGVKNELVPPLSLRKFLRSVEGLGDQIRRVEKDFPVIVAVGALKVQGSGVGHAIVEANAHLRLSHIDGKRPGIGNRLVGDAVVSLGLKVGCFIF